MAPLSDFRGLIGGAEFTPEIFAECSKVNKYYAAVVTQTLTQRQELWDELEKAEAEVEALKKEDAETRKEAIFRRKQASRGSSKFRGALARRVRALIDQVRISGPKQEWNAMAYLSALHAIVCRDRRPGSGA